MKILNKSLLTLGTLVFPVLGFAQQEKRPNLIYVFADQLRNDVLGYNGDEKAITPNIDRFAGEAFNLSNTVSVSPVSAPHRSCLFTGKYVSSTGFVINEVNMNLNHRFFAQVLNDNGYNCGYIGKMHLNDRHTRPFHKGPERIGFDHYWAGYSFNHSSYNSYYYTDDENGNEVKVSLRGKYGPDEFTALACDYMERASKEDKPFAMVLSWNPPHDPWARFNVVPECYEKFKEVDFQLPENFNEVPDPYMDRYNEDFYTPDRKWREDFIHGGGYQETMRCYYAMVNSIDQQFGKILAKLKELGIEDNTIVVFTSDHGEQFTSQGRMYKMIFYDESAHVPFLIRYPDKIKKGRDDVCFNTPDIYPTLLGLMGLEDQIPEEVEGQDLSFVLRREKGERPEFAFMQGMGHTYIWSDGFEWRAVRSQRYLYARYLRDGHEVFHDLKKDPLQMHNLAEDPRYREKVAEYREKMREKMESLNDEFKPCTWYRDHWMYKNYTIKAAARGEFKKDIPLTEPSRR